MKNVTIRDAKRNTIATFEDFPNRESEQKELLRRRFGEGKYYICHGVKSVDDTGAERTRGTQKVMYILATWAALHLVRLAILTPAPTLAQHSPA